MPGKSHGRGDATGTRSGSPCRDGVVVQHTSCVGLYRIDYLQQSYRRDFSFLVHDFDQTTLVAFCQNATIVCSFQTSHGAALCRPEELSWGSNLVALRAMMASRRSRRLPIQVSHQFCLMLWIMGRIQPQADEHGSG